MVIFFFFGFLVPLTSTVRFETLGQLGLREISIQPKVTVRRLQRRIRGYGPTQGGARFTRLPWAIFFVPVGDKNTLTPRV